MLQGSQLNRFSLLNLSQKNLILYDKSKVYCVNFERNFTCCAFCAFFSLRHPPSKYFDRNIQCILILYVKECFRFKSRFKS